MKSNLEAHIENRVGGRLIAWSAENGIPLEYLKCSVPGRRGYPDRMVVWEGNVLFVEYKRPTMSQKAKKIAPRRLQAYIHTKLHNLGFEVHVYDNIGAAVEGITQKIRASRGTTPRNKVDLGGEGCAAIPTSREGENGYGVEGIYHTSATWLRRRIVGVSSSAGSDNQLAQ